MSWNSVKYEVLVKSIEKRFSAVWKVQKNTQKHLVDAFRWVLVSKSFIVEKIEWWLKKYEINPDRKKSVDYFLEILPHLDDELLLFFNEWENNEMKIKEFCDKYMFMPWKGKVTSLYAEMKKRKLLGQDFAESYFIWFQEKKKHSPYEKCDINAVYDFIHRMEDIRRKKSMDNRDV